MKKFTLVIMLGCMTFVWQSCTHTCTCIDANNHIKEIEIDPAESCSDRSGDLMGICS